jgi:hypothetical protein
VRSPFAPFKDAAAGGNRKLILVLISKLSTDAVYGFRDLIWRIPCHVFSKCIAIYPAAGPVGSLGEPICALEHIIRNRNRCFHTKSITIQLLEFKPPMIALAASF